MLDRDSHPLTGRFMSLDLNWIHPIKPNVLDLRMALTCGYISSLNILVYKKQKVSAVENTILLALESCTFYLRHLYLILLPRSPGWHILFSPCLYPHNDPVVDIRLRNTSWFRVTQKALWLCGELKPVSQVLG